MTELTDTELTACNSQNIVEAQYKAEPHKRNGIQQALVRYSNWLSHLQQNGPNNPPDATKSPVRKS